MTWDGSNLEDVLTWRVNVVQNSEIAEIPGVFVDRIPSERKPSVSIVHRTQGSKTLSIEESSLPRGSLLVYSEWVWGTGQYKGLYYTVSD